MRTIFLTVMLLAGVAGVLFSATADPTNAGGQPAPAATPPANNANWNVMIIKGNWNWNAIPVNTNGNRSWPIIKTNMINANFPRRSNSNQSWPSNMNMSSSNQSWHSNVNMSNSGRSKKKNENTNPISNANTR